MTLIYRKTDKGRQEVDTRAHRLSPRLRSVLIVIDGQRHGDALRALVPGDLDEALAALLAGGFIESRPLRPAAEPAAGLSQRKPVIVRYLTDRLGPIAEPAALRIEAARSTAELSAALDMAEGLLRQTAGSGAANTFRALFNTDPLT
jgi:hypothetical protein